ncbi:MAG: hypothetical protein RLZZ419_1969 [Pseudomonadota bacterium]|jgi:hypothetical protein
MTYQIIKECNHEVRVKLIGKLTVHDFQEIQARGKLSLEKFGQFRVLIELEDFEGWSKDTEWENSLFLDEKSGVGMSKIAFVGDEKWKTEIFMFTGQPMRLMAIEFFPQEQFDQAQAWLSKEN